MMAIDHRWRKSWYRVHERVFWLEDVGTDGNLYKTSCRHSMHIVEAIQGSLMP
jgi:hypothetical protein